MHPSDHSSKVLQDPRDHVDDRDTDTAVMLIGNKTNLAAHHHLHVARGRGRRRAC